VKTTLGPKGMNKILQSASTGEIQITNDGATILKSIQLDNPAAKILVNISKVCVYYDGDVVIFKRQRTDNPRCCRCKMMKSETELPQFVFSQVNSYEKQNV
jgi:TCP-1/cpn60 chaperonin family